MAVEARHISLFSPQIPANRNVVNGIEGGNFFMGNDTNNMYGGAMGYGLASGTTVTAADTFIPPPIYGTPIAPAHQIPVKTPMKSDSGLTHSVPVVFSRKRPRDSAAAGITNPNQWLSFPANNNRCGSVIFLGEDISHHVHQYNLEVDQLIAQHAAKVRREVEEQKKSYSRRILRLVEENIAKKLKAKDEEIQNIGKLNWALEEKLKSLCVENQIWRELAQSNEATANALRINLEQVLAQAQAQNQQNGPVADGLTLVDDHHHAAAADVDDGAESCCGSNFVIREEKEGERRRRTAEHKCRNCGKEEASVLVLPCRHLCLCYGCGRTVPSCPICLSAKNATLLINLSSS